MPIGDPIIEALGISWVLETQELATLTYQHPVLGLLQYTGEVPFVPDNVNTLHLTSRGDLPAPEDSDYVKVLPDSVCIRPSFDSNGCGCYDRVTYDTVANQCACKDPGCDCIPQFICLVCDGDKECCTGNACTGGREGVNAPSGPSYELCCDLLGVNVCGVWYCSGGQWFVDIYCDGILITTNAISHDGCPLTLGTTSFDGCLNCEGCVGEDCDPDPPVVDQDCCFGISMPTNLSLAGGGGTVTMVGAGGAARTWGGSGTICGLNGPWGISCTGAGVWTLTYIGAPYCTLVGTCNPLSLSAMCSGCLITVVE